MHSAAAVGWKGHTKYVKEELQCLRCNVWKVYIKFEYDILQTLYRYIDYSLQV